MTYQRNQTTHLAQLIFHVNLFFFAQPEANDEVLSAELPRPAFVFAAPTFLATIWILHPEINIG